jgi:hypothetical protein
MTKRALRFIMLAQQQHEEHLMFGVLVAALDMC